MEPQNAKNLSFEQQVGFAAAREIAANPTGWVMSSEGDKLSLEISSKLRLSYRTQAGGLAYSDYEIHDRISGAYCQVPNQSEAGREIFNQLSTAPVRETQKVLAQLSLDWQSQLPSWEWHEMSTPNGVTTFSGKHGGIELRLTESVPKPIMGVARPTEYSLKAFVAGYEKIGVESVSDYVSGDRVREMFSVVKGRLSLNQAKCFREQEAQVLGVNGTKGGSGQDSYQGQIQIGEFKADFKVTGHDGRKGFFKLLLDPEPFFSAEIKWGGKRWEVDPVVSEMIFQLAKTSAGPSTEYRPVVRRD